MNRRPGIDLRQDSPWTETWGRSGDDLASPRVGRREPQTGPTVLRRIALPAALFATTVFSTLVVGGGWAGSPYGFLDLPLLAQHPEALVGHLWQGLPFAATLIGILFAHEMGHYLTARWHRVDASLPYFLPFPSLLGTMGAVIRMKDRMPHRRALIDIGASGPLAGFVVALPLLLFGLSLSEVRASPVPEQGLPAQSLLGLALALARGEDPFAAPFLGVLVEGPSVLYVLAKRWVVGELPPGTDVYLHPVALAAWFGLLITALNLLPVGQLDGGHVTYALLGGRAQRLGRWVIAVLLVLGIVAWPGWLLWAFLAWKVIRTDHPPVVDAADPLDRKRLAIAWSAVILLVLTFTPVPMQQY